MKLLKEGIIMSSQGRTTTGVDIYNNTTTANITNVTVNGVAITDVFFPITAGNNANGLTNQLGTYTIVVSYNTASGDYVRVTDTSMNVNCVQTVGSSRSFTSQITNGYFPSITVEMGDGSCPP
jgi:hypothetical protein